MIQYDNKTTVLSKWLVLYFDRLNLTLTVYFDVDICQIQILQAINVALRELKFRIGSADVLPNPSRRYSSRRAGYLRIREMFLVPARFGSIPSIRHNLRYIPSLSTDPRNGVSRVRFGCLTIVSKI